MVERPQRVARYTSVRCANCEDPLAPVFEGIVDEHGSWEVLQAQGALRITLTGSYGEMLDTYDGELSAYLCTRCARDLLERNPWMLSLASRALDINVGHACEGEISWTAMSECRKTEDWHGWRPVWRVTRGGNLDDQVSCHWTEAEAEASAAMVPGAVVVKGISANALPEWPKPQ